MWERRLSGTESAKAQVTRSWKRTVREHQIIERMSAGYLELKAQRRRLPEAESACELVRAQAIWNWKRKSAGYQKLKAQVSSWERRLSGTESAKAQVTRSWKRRWARESAGYLELKAQRRRLLEAESAMWAREMSERDFEWGSGSTWSWEWIFDRRSVQV